jgi:hypothetical protein
MFWYILISLLLLFLLWLLLVPVILYTDTTRNRYVVTLPGIIRVRLVPSETLFYIRGWIFFVPFRFDPFRVRKEKSKSRKKKKHRRKPVRMGSLKPMLGAVRVRKLEMDLDTDDYSLNAWLIPAFSLVNGGNIHMQVNFEGSTALVMDLRTRIGTLLWKYSQYRYKSLTIKNL